MKIPKSIDKYIPRIIIYGGLLTAGASGGLEDSITSIKVITLFEIGTQIYQYGQRKGYFPYIRYKYKDEENLKHPQQPDR